jgi:general secretion pathway protein J
MTRLRRRAGFTLLEIIVALGVLAIIAALTFETITNAVRARDMLEANDALNQTARTALAKIKRDLSLAYLTSQTQAVNTFRTVFVAHNDNPDRLWFTSLSHQRLYRDARECDQTEITLWTEDDPTTDGALVLLRREAPRIDQDPEQGGAILPIAYGVKEFEVRFQDPTTNEWRDDWDTTGTETPNRLPRAAQIVLTLLGPDEEDEEKLVSRPFTTQVILEYAPPLKRDLLAGSGT